MENRAFGALATALLLCCAFTSAAATEPLRVLYAEPFQAQTLRTPGAQKPGPANLRVQAFSRTFELQLEDNSRLLRATSAATRARFGAIQLLKGTIKDAPGSWVRLTLKEGRYSGAFWDGAELYAIAPRETLNEALAVPMAAASTAIYRLSDTQGGLLDGTCAVAGSAPSGATPTVKFRSLIRELRAAADSAFAAAPREIEVAMIGDFEFTNRFAVPSAAMLDRMNVVDGIFSSQVGVAIIPTDFITFPANTDPFTSSEPSTLLEQLGNYRNATAAVRSRGLAHLLTGRQLQGDIIGIAYLGSVCTARNGAGLTEVSDFIDSPIVIAHEIGHNFGAPHDGEAGSPCVNTPQTFLMAPQLNFNPTFSACSLQQIQNRIDTASCIVATRSRDLAVSAPAEVQSIINQPFDFAIDVTSLGEVAAVNAILTVEMQSLEVLSATVPGGTCGSPFGSLRCELGDLPPGESRRLTLRLRPFQLFGGSIRSSVISSRDDNPDNDLVNTTVLVTDERVLQISVSPQPLTATIGEPFDLFYDVAAAGTQPLTGVRAGISVDRLRPLAATVSGGSCVIETSFTGVTCEVGDIAVGTPKRIRVQWVADFTGDWGGQAYAFEVANQNVNGGRAFSVHVQPARDIALTSAQSQFQRVPVGVNAPFSLQVASQGRDTVDDVHVRFSTFGSGIALTIDGPLASGCTATGDVTECALGNMAPQTTVTLPFHASNATVMSSSIQAEVVLPTPDDDRGNDFIGFGLDVRLGNDVEIFSFSPSFVVEERPTTLFAQVNSQGANAAENVHVSMTFPAGVVLQSATLGDQPCTLDSANPHQATCSVARMEPVTSLGLQVQFVAPLAGSGTLLLETSCDNDANPDNDSLTLNLDVLPNIDARLIAPVAPERARSDQPVDLLFTVETNKYSLPDARLEFSFQSLDDFSASAPGATCGAIGGGSGYSCEWTSLAANTSVPVTVRAHSSVRSNVAMSVFLGTSATEVDFSNNNAFLTFPIYVPGDGTVTLRQPTASTTVGEFFAVPAVNVTVLQPVENPFVDITFDPLRLESPGLIGGGCFLIQGNVMRCGLFIPGPGTYPFDLQARALAVGDVPIAFRFGAINDFNATNDQQTMTLSIVNATTPPPPSPPPPPPSGGGGGGGGGGGSMSWLLAALLLMMWHHRRARFRVHR